MNTINSDGFLLALDKEINSLKKTVNKGINLRDGKLCYVSELGGYYLFEVPSVHNIPNVSAQIEINNQTYTANITFCSAGIVELIINNFRANVVNYAKLYIDSWKLIENLKEFYKNVKQNASRYPLVALLQDYHDHPRKPLNNILLGQDEACKKAEEEQLTMIWGPPGTGKTHTLANIAINAMNKNKKVLIVSQSNVAVDGAIKKIASILSQNNIRWEGKCFRYGFISDQNLEHSDLSSFWYALKKNSTDFRNYVNCSTEMRNKGTTQSRYKVLRDIRTDITKRALEEEKRILSQDETNRIIATTITKALMSSFIVSSKWDLVIIDEVSMTNIPQILSVASLSSEKIVLVGDFRQLKPISVANTKELTLDIFSYLHVLDENENVITMPYLILLDKQRRMQSKIFEYINKELYLDKMQIIPTVEADRIKSITSKAPFPNEPIITIDYSEYKTYCDSTRTGSRFNPISAFLAVITAQSVVKNKLGVDIITPYSAQADLINLILREENCHINIKASTVHQYQGSENDVIIFDLVESYPKRNVGKLFDNTDDEKMDAIRLLNVASTRAKGKFILLANIAFIKASNNKDIIGFFDYWNAQSRICYTDIATFIKNTGSNTKAFRFYTNTKTANPDFRSDFTSMQYGFTYFHSNNSSLAKDIDKAFLKTARNNKKGSIVCSNTTIRSLPPNLFIQRNKIWNQSVNYNPKDEYFIIDNNIFWYGLPEAFVKKSVYPSQRLCYPLLRVESIFIIELLMKYIEYVFPIGYRVHKPIQNTAQNTLSIKLKPLKLYTGTPRMNYFQEGARVYNEDNGCGTIQTIKKDNRIITIDFDIEGVKNYLYPDAIIKKGLVEILSE